MQDFLHKNMLCSKRFSLLDHFKLVFDLTNDAIALLKVHNNEILYIYANAAHIKLLGKTKEEIFYKSITEIFEADFALYYQKKCSESIEKQSSVLFDRKSVINGKMVVHYCSLIPLSFENESYIFSVDISSTQVKEWMRQNHVSFTNFNKIFDSHFSPMMLIDPKKYEILNANPAASKFYGYSIEELTQMNLFDINVKSSQKLLLKRMKKAENEKTHFQFRHQRKDGSIRFVEIYSSPLEIDHEKYIFFILFDITEREQNKKELYEEKNLLAITMDSISDVVVTTNKQGKITYSNKSAQNMLTTKESDIHDTHFRDTFPLKEKRSDSHRINIVKQVLKTQQKQTLTGELLIAHKSPLFVEINASPILDKTKKICGVVIILRDVTLENEKKKKIEFFSYHDALTGLYNRRFYYDYIDTFQTKDLFPIGFIMGDVNGLKMTNDIFGHMLGDKLLESIGIVMQKTIDKDNIIIRWGGDEFVIIFPQSTQKQLEENILKLQDNFKKIVLPNVPIISVSLGMALQKNTWDSTDNILKKAEEMMYQNKVEESIQMRQQTIYALIDVLIQKKLEPKAHLQRLKESCLMMAKALQLNADSKKQLEQLTYLHDIGKIGLPFSILEKQTPLTLDEMNIIRTHPEIGYRIASNLPSLHSVALEILYHHERWDGNGYPSQLIGEEIPLNCRIFAVAEAYDIMTHNQIYKKAITPQEALDEIQNSSGKQFDPTVVEIFETLIMQKK